MSYTIIASGSTEIKRGGFLGKKYTVSYYLYSDRIHGDGFLAFIDDLDYQPYDIPVDELKQVSVETVEGFKSVVIIHRNKNARYGISDRKTILPGIEDPEKCAGLIRTVMRKNAEKTALLKQKQQQISEENQRKEMEAKRFYENCYAFHVKPDTPVFPLSVEKNKAILIYIDQQKAVNFLEINGYAQEESVGTIPYDRIHYYDRAGNVSYTTDIHGAYSSFGGSMTGAQFSKKAAAIGGALFGMMGMAAGALFSYKPAEIKPASAEFTLDSEIVKIDDRNVILNFFSDSRGQYVDVELPKDIFNFLQTFLPDKKYSIVEELERKAALERTGTGQKQLPVSEAPSALPAADSAEKELAAFKLKVEKLKMMKEAGILSDEEFESERKKLLTLL